METTAKRVQQPSPVPSAAAAAHAPVQQTLERYSRRHRRDASPVSAEVMAAEQAAREQRERKANPYQLDWQSQGTMLYLQSRAGAPVPLVNGDRVAAFDMDGTLIRTRSGRKFPTGRTDWLWLLPCIPDRLRKLHADGWKLVIFTNQNGISTGNQPVADIKGKILDIIKDVGVPMSAFVASADDLYRKPAVNMWSFMTAQHNGGIPVNKDMSVYVGDAAGRPAAWDGDDKTKKDFSASDRKFAHNCGISFYTPEEYFLHEKPAKFS